MDGRADGMEGWVVSAKGVIRLTVVKCARECKRCNTVPLSFPAVVRHVPVARLPR